MENSNGEKPDDLEITCIGALYKGSWDKKYWSSSRGKDRYPYPVGYNAVRTHIGSTYRMEIHEGHKGPLFVITTTDGHSCSGQTPDIAWERFQKKGGPSIKMWHGKRFSCKIDGVELFGFRNPFVQRLLRELVVNVNGMAEWSLLSSSFCNGASGLENETRCPDSCTYPDLLLYLAKPQTTGKRSRKHQITTINAVDKAGLKKLRPQHLSNDTEASIPRQRNQNHRNDQKLMTSSTSKEEYKIRIDPGGLPVQVNLATVVEEGNSPFSVKDGSLLDCLKEEAVFSQEQGKLVTTEDCTFPCVANEFCKQVKLFDRPLDADMQECSSLMERENNNGEESKTVKDVDLCAPDTLDIMQDNITDSAPDTNKSSPCNGKDELVAIDTVMSEGLLTELHPEEEAATSTSNASSEKSDFDSVGQEVAKSMMTVLLPQAVPLLEKISRKGRETSRILTNSLTENDPFVNLVGVKSQEECNDISHLIDVASPGRMHIEGSHVEREENMHILGRALGSVPIFEDIKSVIPDSFEDDQCGYHVTNQIPLCSDIAVADQATFGKDLPNPDALGLLGNTDGGNESSIYHVGTGGNKESFCYNEVPMTSNEVQEKGKILTLVSSVDCISPNKQILFEEPKDDCTNFLEPAFLRHTHALSPSGKTISTVEVSNSSPSNQPPNAPTSFQSKRPLYGPELVPLSSETAYLGNAVSPSGSANNLEIMRSEVPKTKLVQYHRRHHCRDVIFQSTNIHSDQPTSITDRNQNNPDNDWVSATIDKRDANLLETVGSVHISQKEVDVKTGATRTGKYSFIERPDVAPSTRKYSGPLSEIIICRSIVDGCVPETCDVRETLPATEMYQAGSSDRSLNRKMAFVSETRLDRQPHGLHAQKDLKNQAVDVITTQDKDSSSFLDPSISNVEKYEANVVNELAGPYNLLECRNSVSWFQEQEISFSNKNGCDAKEVLVDSNMHPQMKSVDSRELHQECQQRDSCFTLEMEPNSNSKGFVELLGCYMHPTPVLSVLLNTKGDDIYICVLCGLLGDKARTLFIYKIPTKEPRIGCPSFIGYTSVTMPISKDTFGKEITFDRSGLQLTPDGQCLVFISNIKAPCCRERRIQCLCSVCASDCSVEKAVKVVRVKLGYVSVSAKLTTVENVHCILVCEPRNLVAVGESGRLQVWIMNSTWSAKIEEFILPTCILPCIVELKKIPNCASVIVGHNGFGDFGLWDISKRTLLSRFSAPGISVFEFLPVGLFSWQREGHVPTDPDMEDHTNDIMAATKSWFSGASEDCAFLPSKGEDIAVWLLVSTVSDSEAQNDYQSNDCSTSTVGSWRLALLVKNTVILGGSLDPRTHSLCRASTVGASAGFGIIGTRDGLVYMWEMSTGTKLSNLHYFEGGGVSCITADSRLSVLAVAGDECQLLVYVHSPRASTN
ncbi:hypothetical protein HHK36_015517 [Tetracentron sinense]|uniref:Uncharacterized protein n=1 Tax=Tetracentron sinense TaxID=13715 RepID=A0A835DCW7_TETSI|nr:hypothetical protein HHK36_015517 [Tetracentron sinense]